MAGPEVAQRSAHPPSLIPIPSAKPPRSGIPSTISLPQLSLAPTWQQSVGPPPISVSGTPVRPSPSSYSSASSGNKTPGSAVASFRSLRNLLPFGVPKSSATNGTPQSKDAFGSTRRSMSVERGKSEPLNNASPKSNVGRSLSMDRGQSLQANFPEFVFHSSPSVSPRKGLDDGASHVDSNLSPSYITGADLSTIMESDTSGISKHIPDLDESEAEIEDVVDLTHSPGSQNQFGGNQGPSSERGLPSPAISISAADDGQIAKPRANKSTPASPSQPQIRGFAELKHAVVRRIRSALTAGPEQSSEQLNPSLLHVTNGRSRDRTPSSESASGNSSFLDLSTSKINVEVLDAILGQKDFAFGQEPVIVDDGPSTAELSPEPEPDPEHSANEVGDANVSFDFNNLDPELAALLSPNTMTRSTDFNSGFLGRPVSSSSPLTSSPPPRRTLLPRPSAFSPTSPSFPSPSPSPPPSSLPPPKHQSGHDQLIASMSGRRASVDITRRQPSSPLSSPEFDQHLPSNLSRPRTSGGESSSAHGALARSASSSSATRPSLRNFRTNSSDMASTSSSTVRASASVDPSTRWLHNSGQNSSSLNGSATPPPDQTIRASSSSFFNLRNRKRSLSASESPRYPTSSGRPRAPEWLGPRTAKAFAEAGLLDFDGRSASGSALEGGGGGGGRTNAERARFTPSRTSSERARFTPSRSSSERDSRALYAPSRMALSEVSGSNSNSNSSWGRRSSSVSRTMTASVSERGGGFVDRENAMTPSTSVSQARSVSVFSAAGSGSANTSHKTEVALRLQALREKHALETEALLAALVDSQRMTRVLREENVKLRDRIDELEEDLKEALVELRQRPHNVPPSSLSPSRGYTSGPTGRDLNSGRNRGARVLPERMQSFTPPEQEQELELDEQPSLDVESDSPLLDLDDPRAAESPALAETSLVRSRRRRDSTPSSVFAVLPSNMSMLMNEEGEDEHLDGSGVYSTASPPASPTLVLPLLPKQQSYTESHAGSPPRRSTGHVADPDKSISASSTSSMGNISPITANFSMGSRSIPGSPGSLNLRPEHEMHLGDMISLNLDADDGSD